MNKKQKVLVSTLTPILGVTAIVTPLAVIYANQKTKMSPVEQWADKKFNITKKTYKTLMRDYSDRFESYLEEEGKGDLEWIAKQRLQFNNSMKAFDIKAKNQANGYTTLTSAIVDHAKKTYGFNLARETNITDADISTAWESCKESFRSYMDAVGIVEKETQEKIITQATEKFKEEMEALDEQNIADPLIKLQKAQRKMTTCFDMINDEISLTAAAIRISEFEERYSLNFKTADSTNKNASVPRFNLLKAEFEKAGVKVGDPLGVKVMSDNFVMIDTETGEPVDMTDGSFSFNNLLPGYELVPHFAGWTEDPKANNYSMNIDWTAKSTTARYQTSNNDEDVTAHNYYPIPNEEKGGDFFTVTDVDSTKQTMGDVIKSLQVQYDGKFLGATNDFEIQQLSDTYFNTTDNESEGHIEFKFADVNECAWEAIFSGTKGNNAKGEEVYKMDASLLGAFGIQIRQSTKNDWEHLDAAIIRTGLKTQTNFTNTNLNATLLDSFLQNVEVEGEVKVLHDGDEQGNVAEVKLFAKYHNSNGTQRYQIAETFTTPEGIQVSDEFFDKTACAYLSGKRYFDAYSANHMKDLHIKSEAYEISLITFIALNGLYMIYATTMLFLPTAAESPETGVLVGGIPFENKMRCALGLVLGGACEALCGMALYKWIHEYREPLKKKSDLVDEFKNEPVVKQIYSIFDADKELLEVPLLEEDLTPDRESKIYKQKLNTFKTKPVGGDDGTMAKLKYYSNIRYSSSAVAFRELVQSEKYKPISTEGYTAFAAPWEADGDKQIEFMMLYIGGVLLTMWTQTLFAMDMANLIRLRKDHQTKKRQLELDEQARREKIREAQGFQGNATEDVQEIMENGTSEEVAMMVDSEEYNVTKAKLYCEITNTRIGGKPRFRGYDIPKDSMWKGGFDLGHGQMPATEKYFKILTGQSPSENFVTRMRELTNWLNDLDFTPSAQWIIDFL